MNRTHLTWVLLGLFIFISCVLLYPNSFGNSPDLLQDESYFLTSSLGALQSHTLPGWEFSASGAYYGGVQTYLDSAALVPVIAYQLALNHFSLGSTEVFLALHTGDLLQVLRLVSGVSALGMLALFFYYLYKRRAQEGLALMLLLVLTLVLGNSVALGLLHTAKVWALYIVIDVSMGALWLCQEYYVARGESFISKERYVALLSWGTVLAFFQNFVGVFSALLWVLYALLLGHARVRDFFAYALKRWWLFILFALTQISFVYRGFILRAHPSVLDLADTSSRSADNNIVWAERLSDPIKNAVLSQPLVLLYVVGLLALAYLLYCKGLPLHKRERIYLAIGALHPLLVFAIFYGGLGFSLFPRYSLMLAIACAFSSAILLGTYRRALIGALVLSAMLFAVVGAQSIRLFWSPGSSLAVQHTIEAHYNSPSTVFIIDPSAARLSLPLTERSLSLLSNTRKGQSRFTFLLQHLSLVPNFVSFTPTVVFADTAAEEASYIKTFATSSVWTISQACSAQCSTAEGAAGSCVVINPAACGAVATSDQKEYPVVPLQSYLSQTQLGITYLSSVHTSATRA